MGGFLFARNGSALTRTTSSPGYLGALGGAAVEDGLAEFGAEDLADGVPDGVGELLEVGGGAAINHHGKAFVADAGLEGDGLAAHGFM